MLTGPDPLSGAPIADTSVDQSVGAILRIVMRRLLALLPPILLATSCSYARDRGRDLADVFTLAVTSGVGIGAQVGPIVPVIGSQGTILGLEDGAVVAGVSGEFPWGSEDAGEEMGFLLLSGKRAGPSESKEKRNKGFEALFLGGVLPTAPHGSPTLSRHFWTKLEASAALGVGVKVGFNPGELVDFMLGWVGVDMYDDDRREHRWHSAPRAERSSDRKP